MGVGSWYVGGEALVGGDGVGWKELFYGEVMWVFWRTTEGGRHFLYVAREIINCESSQVRCCAWVPWVALPSKFRRGSRVSSDLCNWLERFDDLPKVKVRRA